MKAPAIPRRPFPRRRTAGSVVLLVLLTVLLGAFMITKFVERAGTELLADARGGDQARLRRTAYSALEATLAVLADVKAVDGGLFSPAQGWDDPLETAGFVPDPGQRVEVEFVDESGRLSLPKVDEPTLAGLFESLGVTPDKSEKAAAALLVWMHPDYVPPSLDADPELYEREVIPHTVAGRPLRTLAELASIAVVRDLLFDEDRQPNELHRQFVAAVSLQSFDHINLNAASPAALVAAGLDPSQVNALRDYLNPGSRRAARPYFQNAADASAVLGANAPMDKFGVEIQVLRVNVIVRDGGQVYRISAVVGPPGTAGPPRRGVSTEPSVTQPPTETAPVVIKKLDYPFKVLELLEDVESLPVPADAPVLS